MDKLKRFKAFMGYPQYVENRPVKHGELPYYLCFCSKCGFYEAYPSGFPGEEHFHCPTCKARTAYL